MYLASYRPPFGFACFLLVKTRRVSKAGA